MWKANNELGAIGWIGSKRPRMVAVQAEGCAPIVKAYDEGTNMPTRGPMRIPLRRAFAYRRDRRFSDSRSRSRQWGVCCCGF